MSSLEVPTVLVDEDSGRILLAALSRPRTALQIARSSGTPVAEAFRRIRMLERMGLLRAEMHVRDRQGREVPVYRSTLRDGYMFVDNGRLRVRFQLVAGVPESSDERGKLR